MSFDQVHSGQLVFRRVLDAMARPGLAQDIREVYPSLDMVRDLDRGGLALALCLLDAETSFSWMGPSKDSAQSLLSRLCSCAAVDADKAAFIFCEGQDQLPEALALAKCGELESPQLGATIIALALGLGSGPSYLASGPGIRETLELRLGPNSESWLSLREGRNAEFPLGLDMLLLDASGSLIALPRTTRLWRD